MLIQRRYSKSVFPKWVDPFGPDLRIPGQQDTVWTRRPVKSAPGEVHEHAPPYGPPQCATLQMLELTALTG